MKYLAVKDNGTDHAPKLPEWKEVEAPNHREAAVAFTRENIPPQDGEFDVLVRSSASKPPCIVFRLTLIHRNLLTV